MLKWAIIASVVLIIVVVFVLTGKWLSLISLVSGFGLGFYIAWKNKK